MNLPPLHGHSAALLVHAGDQPLPLPGVFNWHYLQCVIHRFNTQQYKGFFTLSLLHIPSEQLCYIPASHDLDKRDRKG
jgi:hypothetical protein